MCALLSTLALLLAPLGASAQENGLKLGNGRIHPSFELESRYDTLAGYVGRSVEGSEAAVLSPVEDLILHYRPGLKFELASDALTVKVEATVDFTHYQGLIDEGTTEQNRLDAGLTALAVYDPEGRISAKLSEAFRRGDETKVLALGVGAVSDSNEARVAVGIQPWGEALVVEPSYALGFEHFEPRAGALAEGCQPNDPVCDPAAVDAFDYLNHALGVGARWKFFPKTAFVVDSSIGYRDFLDDVSNTFDTINFTATAGVVGLLTSRIATTLRAGWGDQLQTAGYSSMIGTADVSYLFSETADVKLGYQRSFEPNPTVGLFYVNDRISLTGKSQLVKKLNLRSTVSYDIITFGEGRVDTMFSLGAEARYGFLSWLNSGLGYDLTVRDSTTDRIGFDFNRHELSLSVQAIY